jgi:hypothetical protein
MSKVVEKNKQQKTKQTKQANKQKRRHTQIDVVVSKPRISIFTNDLVSS